MRVFLLCYIRPWDFYVHTTVNCHKCHSQLYVILRIDFFFNNCVFTEQKMKILTKDFFWWIWPNPQFHLKLHMYWYTKIMVLIVMISNKRYTEYQLRYHLWLRIVGIRCCDIFDHNYKIPNSWYCFLHICCCGICYFYIDKLQPTSLV